MGILPWGFPYRDSPVGILLQGRSHRDAPVGIHKGDSLHEGGSLYIGDSLYETAEESVFPSLWRSLWRGRLVLVVGVGSKCFLIPGLLVWDFVILCHPLC